MFLQKERSDSSNLSVRNNASKKIIYRNFPIPSQHTEQSYSCSQTPSIQSQSGNIQQNKISTQLRDAANPNPFTPNTTPADTVRCPSTTVLSNSARLRQGTVDQEPATSQTLCNINRRLFEPSQTVNSSSSQELRIIPKFLAKMSSHSVTRPSSNPGSLAPPVVPVFKVRTGGGQRKQREGSGQTNVTTCTGNPSCTTLSVCCCIH